MKHIIDIALKDIRQLLRDKMTFLFLLAMPIAFTLLFGFAFGGLGGGPADQKSVVGFVDLDGSRVSDGLKRMLENRADLRVEVLDTGMDGLEERVANGEFAAAVIVPEGYGLALADGRISRPQVILDASTPEGRLTQNALSAVSWRAVSAAAAARIAADDRPERFGDSFDMAVNAWMNPPARIAPTEVESQAGMLPITHTAPAMMIQFALAGLLTAAQLLVQERKSRCMQRLLTTRVRRHEILLGHLLAIFVVIFSQFVLLTGFGQLLLGLNYLRLPLATLVMMLSAAFFTAALGLMIGALARSDEQAVIYAMVPMFVLSALGGAWLPLEATGEAFRAVGQVTPVALALQGFQNAMASGLAVQAVLLPAAALIGYALACLALAVWKFQYE